MSIRKNKDSCSSRKKCVRGIFTQKTNDLKADHFDVKLAKKGVITHILFKAVFVIS